MPKTRNRRRKPTGPSSQPLAHAGKTRRRFRPRRLVRGILIALAILAVPATWLILEERNVRTLADLSVIGSGEPVAVQVFDQRRSASRRLRDNAERALANIEHPPAWRVVNINTTHGARFAGEHLVDHVSIVLFDERGQRIDVIRGVASVGDLETAFTDLRGQTVRRAER